MTKWTTTPPTEPGYYWHRSPELDELVDQLERDEKVARIKNGIDHRGIPICIQRNVEGVLISNGLTKHDGAWCSLKECHEYWNLGGHEWQGPVRPEE